VCGESARRAKTLAERGDTRNELYARVGRIRAQSETMLWVEVSEIEHENKVQKEKIEKVTNCPRGLVILDVDLSQPGQCASHSGWDGRA
jgi:hypothetical protein